MRRRTLLAALPLALLGGASIPARATTQETRLRTDPFLDATVARGETLFASTITELMHATLTDAEGTPIAGRSIEFTSAGRLLCVATTDADGFASCGRAPGGYTATFGGDGYYYWSSAQGYMASIHSEGTEVRILSGETLLEAWTD